MPSRCSVQSMAQIHSHGWKIQPAIVAMLGAYGSSWTVLRDLSPLVRQQVGSRRFQMVEHLNCATLTGLPITPTLTKHTKEFCCFVKIRWKIGKHVVVLQKHGLIPVRMTVANESYCAQDNSRRPRQPTEIRALIVVDQGGGQQGNLMSSTKSGRRELMCARINTSRLIVADGN